MTQMSFDLADPYVPGAWLADLDGDGLPDAVTARIVLPPSAGPDVALAAGELAARLALESLALDREIVAPPGTTPAPGDISILPPDASGAFRARIAAVSGIVEIGGGNDAAIASAIRFLARHLPEALG
ncbi:MAG: hypothetical protein ACR2J8_08990, partial [Thermomicrobiales bacterium]